MPVLTVGVLRAALRDEPDDREIWIDFETDYDGMATTREGPATDVSDYNGRLSISGSDYPPLRGRLG